MVFFFIGRDFKKDSFVLKKKLNPFFIVPIIIDTKLQATDCQWNHDGSVLAVCGMKQFGSEKDSNIVIFYSAFGVVSKPLNPLKFHQLIA